MVSSAFRLDRCPLDEAALRSALGVPNRAPLWRKLDVVASTASTNADVAAAAANGSAEGLVLIAERQRAGKGRHDREWISPPHAGLEFSVARTEETNRGRQGLRECHVIHRPAGLRDVGLWTGLAAICMVLSRRVEDGVEGVEFRYYISSFVGTAEE